jgi:hypothetical protein
LGAKGRYRIDIAGHGVVLEVTSYHACKPPALHGNWLVPTKLELFLDLSQLRPYPLRYRDTPQPETPIPRLSAYVRETKKIERLGPTKPTRRPPSGSMPPEFDQPRLIRVQLQIELREPLPKVDKKPLRISLMLETHNEIITETHNDHITMRIPTSPPVSPQVEDIV